jgi:hypothetical protein
MQQVEFQKKKDKRNKNKINAYEPIAELKNSIISLPQEDLEKGNQDKSIEESSVEII